MGTRCRVRGMAVTIVALLASVNLSVAAQDGMSYRIAVRDFSTLYAEVDDGLFDLFPPEQVVVEILETESGLTRVQRQWIAELLVMRVERSSAATGSPFPLSLVAALLERFDQLDSPTLRARVLKIGSEMDATGMATAVHASARRLAVTLAAEGDDTVQGYEVEAIALCDTAPDYPSLPLADLLRSIAAHSRDRRVVDAARLAARAILATM